MINSIYIIRNNEIWFSTIKGADAKSEKQGMTPFLSAIDDFTNESFKGKVKTLIVDDDNTGEEKRIYFMDFSIDSTVFKIVAVLTNPLGKTWYSFWEYSSKVAIFKDFLHQENFYNLPREEEMKEEERNQIQAKIKKLFNFERFVPINKIDGQGSYYF
ncbi:MAG: hypothetical protein ACFFCS_23835 [Candidatus Hodarchaeota archaeon]